MYRTSKLDAAKVFKLRALGLSNAIIAQRLGVTQGAIYHVLRKHDAEHGAAGGVACIPGPNQILLLM